ncbi:Plant lipid transfer protein/Par allergen [Sesbania bispinosa]|nr:Plant lipid transfer protein/Par allergen [Sesbania bispinosa]
MAMGGSLKMACVVVMCMAVVGAPIMAEAAITCGSVTQSVAPCLSFLVNGGSASQGCCTGVRNILGAATTTADRQAVCNCLKSAAGAVSRINDKYVQALPAQCNVNIPFKISTSTNCAKYVIALTLLLIPSHKYIKV